MKITKSPVHWIGGKKKMLKHILEHMPEKFENYFEPFLGSGIVFVNIPKSKYERAYIGDFNSDIVNIFRTIRDKPEKVIGKLMDLENKFNNTEQSLRKTFFLQARSHLNTLHNVTDNLERACYYIFINKTSFSGVMQSNRKNQISSSFGNFSARNPRICFSEDIRILSKQLQKHKASIYNYDYNKTLKKAKKGDFIFLDPPYLPDPNTKYTVKYQRHGIFSTTKKEDGWQEDDFLKVVNMFHELADRGCFVMMTNYDTPFIREHLSKYQTTIIETKRKLTSKTGKNKHIQRDILITNYSI